MDRNRKPSPKLDRTPISEFFPRQDSVVGEGAYDHPRRDIEMFSSVLNVFYSRRAGADHFLKLVVRTQEFLCECPLELLPTRDHRGHGQESFLRWLCKVIRHQASQ